VRELEDLIGRSVRQELSRSEKEEMLETVDSVKGVQEKLIFEIHHCSWQIDVMMIKQLFLLHLQDLTLVPSEIFLVENVDK
jgi:hypothetical protein